jgi:hypothetical protein
MSIYFSQHDYKKGKIQGFFSDCRAQISGYPLKTRMSILKTRTDQYHLSFSRNNCLKKALACYKKRERMAYDGRNVIK